MVIIAIGENASSPKTDEARIQFATALRISCPNSIIKVIPHCFIRSQFWQEAEKDQLLKKACADAGGIFCRQQPARPRSDNYARAERKIEHEGVAAHPGDKGMAAIAEELWKAMKKAADSTKVTVIVPLADDFNLIWDDREIQTDKLQSWAGSR